MARQMDQLSALIRERGRRFKTKANKIMRITFLQMAGDVAKSTPVDTGILRASWNVSFHSPNRKIATSANKTKGYQDFNRELGTGSFLENSVFLTNASKYAVVVEYGGYVGESGGRANGPKTVNGFSKQAPVGMLRKTVKLYNRYLIKELSRNG